MMIKTKTIIANLIIGTGMTVSVTATAADAAAGEQAYLTKGCIGCHGPAGKSPNEATFPTLAGKEAAYLSEQLNAFRSGERQNPMMSSMSMTLTDEDVANLAAYLSAAE